MRRRFGVLLFLLSFSASGFADDFLLVGPAARCESARNQGIYSYFMDLGEYEAGLDTKGRQALFFRVTTSRTVCRQLSERYSWWTIGTLWGDELQLVFFKGAFKGKRYRVRVTPNPPVQRWDHIERTSYADFTFAFEDVLSKKEQALWKTGQTFVKEGHLTLCRYGICVPGYRIFINFPRP